MLRSLDLNTAAEAGTVQGFTLQTVARLSPNDAVLPQVLSVCEMVKRGIGVVSLKESCFVWRTIDYNSTPFYTCHLFDDYSIMVVSYQS